MYLKYTRSKNIRVFKEFPLGGALWILHNKIYYGYRGCVRNKSKYPTTLKGKEKHYYY